ncbi:MAG: glutamate formimidoyltransferase [Negativicutes bacterium]|nr:glutamate formimidoyltransferase [Negativicutes bacterium]
MFEQIVECVPNFSEGRNKEVIEKIVEPLRRAEGVKLLDYSADVSHNRLVVTVVGLPAAVRVAVIEAVGQAVQEIDLNRHKGEHPRMGAADVIPFIPVRNVTMELAVSLARETAKEIFERFRVPTYLYEKAATRPERENLANIRKGEFEGFKEKIKLPEWMPDFGTAELHPTAGATVVGARAPLVAFNVNLGTSNLEIADKIAKRVRHISGGLRYVKAIGVSLEDRGIVQVSMNMTDFTRTSLYQAFEMVKMEARRYGIPVIGSEIIGLTPQEALIDTAVYYLGLENFSSHQILENRLME